MQARCNISHNLDTSWELMCPLCKLISLGPGPDKNDWVASGHSLSPHGMHPVSPGVSAPTIAQLSPHYKLRVNMEEWAQISLHLPVWTWPKFSLSLLLFSFYLHLHSAFWSRNRAWPKPEPGGRKADGTGFLVFILLFNIQYRHCFKLHKNSL